MHIKKGLKMWLKFIPHYAKTKINSEVERIWHNCEIATYHLNENQLLFLIFLSSAATLDFTDSTLA
jgi:hypothetical protein